jgi:hypothetical protein
VSIWQLERDPSFPGRTFAGFGRYALFEILGASREVRLVLDLTTSPTQPPNGSYLLPPASVVGATRVPLPLVGSGSGRVVSPPVRPRVIGGRPYILLDMGRKGQFPIVPRPGATGLWGSSVLLDSRLLTSYVRDISLIPANASRHAPPAALRSLPRDLGSPGLEYSGIFEDGWVAKDSYARISGEPGRLTIRGEVAPAPRDQRLQVLVDGRPVWSRDVRPGPLSIGVSVASSPRSRKVELRFAGASRLAPADPRQVAARLTYLGVASPPRSVSSVPADLRTPGLVYSGIFADGWLGQDARLVLAGGPAATLRLRADVSVEGQQLTIRVNGRIVAATAAGAGHFARDVAIPASASPRSIELRGKRTAPIAPNDPRAAAALLRSLAIVGR